MTDTKNPKTYYVFTILTQYLREFVEDVQAFDEMRGNQIEIIEKDKCSSTWTVVISREMPYPYVMDNLRERWG